MADDDQGGSGTLSDFMVLHSKDFSQLEKNLMTTIEDFKKVPGHELSAVRDAALAYRKNMMQLNESANKLALEMSKLADTDTLPANKHWKYVADVQSSINQKQSDWSNKLWDDFILPLMDAQTNERTALGPFTEKIKESTKQYEEEAKKLLAQRKKAKGNKIEEDNYNKQLQDIKLHYGLLEKGINEFKESRYTMWLKSLVHAMNSQRDFHAHSLTILQAPELSALENPTGVQPPSDFPTVAAQLPEEKQRKPSVLRRLTMRGLNKKKEIEEEKAKMEAEERAKNESTTTTSTTSSLTTTMNNKDSIRRGNSTGILPPDPTSSASPTSAAQPPPPIARDVPSTPPDSPWKEAKTPEGETYYYHVDTNETRWELPQ